ncbi:NADP-dependent oxaloacetate-decarboxylating malate dehydrogenase [Serratia sp. TSA_198.1]|jgi:malate dehydrogenase (oxaloacetate-decarboxylating)(NADP+)|uniref:NADP-dependent oxaloacetate-decarboxylating malate dehydrogenase n=2 Tax=Serratia plymuthica TaxID=82996 RepID=A0A7T2WAV0_SERPL|nr:NADP-dependent oxaloacetate-decarboxylating malate dehydrogenase [Serratia plymuthica]KYQ97527.1 malic enzyme [Serratia plymuthica]QPS19723.1 NADP-dependent oxaloacetate-decarboxylating malate dehydrogenase [Serratia plymuthica]QPS61435.1 NADP-dependent oxaloacetate-decarboxylating malate dehydrogenase [Serratia plymuthica]RKS61490.1 allosteric NADP-dependent malic enzyme [Serratia plymuthica]UNK29505.1 NADP-dependent oxaloacetate-decarboxylating malate dehydrogenase [Serratia plymuthica]
MDEQLKQSALDFHQFPVPGKIQVSPTKPLATQRDLALAYSPGVAAPCLEIAADPLAAYKYTARGNLVAVISNGTAVLGLGNIGALAGKPVMEGKGVLFKKFSGIDVFDIEVDELNPDKLIDIIASLEPTFGGINLEDIKAPECFYIEQKLRERMKIPVFHDDQHGTAIITTAAVLNGLRVVKKNISDVRLVVSGAGAASIACLNLLVALGLRQQNITVCDSKGVIYKGRDANMEQTKAAYAIEDNGQRTLGDAIPNADIFLGCSGPGVLTQDMVKTMARDPLIMALANPEPEILPPLAKAVRPDAIICTGRSDYPNQVNNVLCFPFIFRGALDVGATTINEEMKLACVHAIADLALAEQNDVVASAYGDQDLSFGPEYIIPKPFDPRLIVKIAPAVARAAMESGVATRPIEDFDAYVEKLSEFVYKTNLFMKPIFALAKKEMKRVVLAEGEEERVLHATQELVSQGLAYPILVGRPSVIEMRLQKLGLQLTPGKDFEVVNNESDPRFNEYWGEYYQIMKRRGVSQEQARRAVIGNPTLIAAIMLHRGEADAMICGTIGSYHEHYEVVKNVFGFREGAHVAGAMNALLLPSGNTFIADTYVNDDPTPEQLAEITLMAAETVRRFGIEPKVALLSHSSFGSSDCPAARKMRKTLELVNQMAPELEIDGEMHGDAALVESIRHDLMPDSPLKGAANVLIMPNMEAARISYNLLRVSSSEGVTVGPVLMGVSKPVHILTPIASVRRIVNMVALAVVEAQTEPL